MTENEIRAEVLKLVKLANRNPRNKSLEDALDQVVRTTTHLHNLPEFRQVAREAFLRQMVQDNRHTNNRIYKTANRAPIPQQKIPHQTEEGDRVQNLYLLSIGSRHLGDLRKEELLHLANDCQEQAQGLMANAVLLRKLYPLVGANKTVRQCVKPAQLRRLFMAAEEEATLWFSDGQAEAGH